MQYNLFLFMIEFYEGKHYMCLIYKSWKNWLNVYQPVGAIEIQIESATGS